VNRYIQQAKVTSENHGIDFVLSIGVAWVSILYTLSILSNNTADFAAYLKVHCSQTSNRHTTSRHAIARIPVSDLDTQRLHRKERKKQKNMATKEEIHRENPIEKNPISSFLHSDQFSQLITHSIKQPGQSKITTHPSSSSPQNP
jgi:hypothetical protein